MKNWEQQLNQLETPQGVIESHRAKLRNELHRTPSKKSSRSLVMGLTALILIGGLTVAYPSWAKNLYKYVLLSEKKVQATDGTTMTTRTYQTQTENGQPVNNTGSVQLQADANGNIQQMTSTDTPDPALVLMKNEAEEIVRTGQAKLILNERDIRAYKVKLRDGRQITFISGPGTSWSISQ